MKNNYSSWLEAQGYVSGTCVAQIHRVKKVEQYYGDLDELIGNGAIAAVVGELTYTTADERKGLPNPSKIEFNGNIRNNLASYKNAVTRYVRFVETSGGIFQADDDADERSIVGQTGLQTGEMDGGSTVSQKLALERDMQAALRRDISSLDPDLNIVDDGAEMSVDTGFIDILCEDRTGAAVVIELKAGKTDARVVGQILGYMGDLITEDPERPVRGIIVAHDFDKRTAASARAIPNLSLKSYSISFSFENVE